MDLNSDQAHPWHELTKGGDVKKQPHNCCVKISRGGLSHQLNCPPVDNLAEKSKMVAGGGGILWISVFSKKENMIHNNQSKVTFPRTLHPHGPSGAASQFQNKEAAFLKDRREEGTFTEFSIPGLMGKVDKKVRGGRGNSQGMAEQQQPGFCLLCAQGLLWSRGPWPSLKAFVYALHRIPGL